MLFVILFPVLVVCFAWRVIKGTPKKSIRFKHICITGGSSGIGNALAIVAAQNGAHVTIIARNVERLENALNSIENQRIYKDQRVRMLSLDCTDASIIEESIKQIDQVLPIDIFVNCAGFAKCGVFEEMSHEDIKQLFDVNYFATVYPLRAVVPLMKQRKSGTIVITGSQGGLCGIYGYSIYASTKFALRGLAETLSMECREYNISVTLCLPPDTDTPGFETENLSKPVETKLISGAAGVVKPEVVARQLLDDALKGKFFSCVGFESKLMTTLCVGMSPFLHFYEVVAQAIFLGPCRLICSFYIRHFQNLVKKCKEQREMGEKIK